MSAYGHGRHEHGQNFLTNHKIINSIIDLVKQTSGPIIEIGPGSGALTHPMAHLGRAITAVEVDAKLAAKITQETSSAAVEVVHDDFLNFRLPATPCVIVGNIPFHCQRICRILGSVGCPTFSINTNGRINLTTAILRKLLHAPAWTDAVLLMQWEVARRRAGVGASTMMTAQWSPWFTFHLGSRVPRTAFRPQPNVDGGILVIRRVGDPKIPIEQRKAFQAMVHTVFTARGRGIGEILRRAGLFSSRSETQSWLRSRGIDPATLPPRLHTNDWIDLFQVTGSSLPHHRPISPSGSSQRPPQRKNRSRRR